MGEAQTERSRAVEDYVKAIRALSAQKGGGSVGTGELAARLGVTPASASGMVRRLVEKGLVTHSPYRGFMLTGEGESLALAILRRHRLLETFLAERLGLPWDRVHAEAEVLEHVLSTQLEEAIALDLGDPERDPHGAPIPRADGSVVSDRTIPLDQVAAGSTARFVRIPDEHPEMLRWLGERSIEPECEVEVIGREPFGGPLVVRVGGVEHALGAELASAMRMAAA